MGHNVDLQNLLGLPEFVRCPQCKEMTPTYFDEYDIDCGNPEAKKGANYNTMLLSIQCRHCTTDFNQIVKIEVVPFK